MARDKILTNANDVTLIVSYPSGSATAGPQGRLVVDNFSLERNSDISSHSGVGNRKPRKISLGDIEYEWDFTAQGEDRQLFESVVDDEGVPQELSLTVYARDMQVKLSGAFCSTDSFEGTSGEATEMSFEGMATDMDRDAAPSN